MSDTGLGGVDVSLGLEELGAELLAYFQTPEGQTNLAASGFEVPVIPAEALPTGVVTGGRRPVVPEETDDGETEAERIARLEREAEDARRANELEFARGQAAAETARRRQDARTTMASVLNTYGLGELSDYIYNEIIVKETVNINNPDAIIFAIREQPAYKKRFAANATRLKNGLTELLPGEYIGLEDQFKTMIRSNGLPAGFYDSEDDLRKLIEGDVSPSEFQRRIQDGYNAVVNADPEVKRQFKDFYGVTDGGLAAYFLDPKRGEPLLANQARAAQIAASGLQQGGIQLTGTFAENLAQRGITEQQARAGFA
jgi:hypothetical protein